MIDYNLEANEVLLVELRCNAETNSNRAISHDVALTNNNIILVYKGTFGKVKEIRKYPLYDVNIFDGRAAIIFNEKLLDSSIINITMKTDRIQIRFAPEEKKKGREFANQLNKLVSNEDENIAQSSIPGMRAVADSVKGTIDVFKNSFGIKPKKLVVRCSGCGVNIAGEKGKIVYCQYCGVPNQI